MALPFTCPKCGGMYLMADVGGGHCLKCGFSKDKHKRDFEKVIKDVMEKLCGFVNAANRREEKWVWRSDIQNVIDYIHETCWGNKKPIRDIWDLI